MIVIDEVEQGSPEWYELRKVPSGSRANMYLTPAKLSFSSQATKLAARLVAKRAGADDAARFGGNAAMQRGIKQEENARRMAEFLLDTEIREVGFVFQDDGLAGCSPDGLIYEDGKPVAGCEFKCPDGPQHILYAYEGVLPSEYIPQVRHCLEVTGLERWHFLSYHEQLPPFLITVERDDDQAKVTAALDKLKALIETMSAKLEVEWRNPYVPAN